MEEGVQMVGEEGGWVLSLVRWQFVEGRGGVRLGWGALA